jgi:hypothetical protein
MKILRKLFASVMLMLVIGVPAWAGEMNSPPAPPPPPAACTTNTSGGAAADSNCAEYVNAPAADVDAATVAINLLVSMLSIY